MSGQDFKISADLDFNSSSFNYLAIIKTLQK